MKLRRPENSEWQVRRPQRLASKLPFHALVIGVPDGDTLQISTSIEYISGDSIEYVRLAGIDAPEIRSQDVVNAVRSQQELYRLVFMQIVTVRPRRIWRDPYSRIIADVVFEGRDIGTCLLQSGHAKIRRETKRLQIHYHTRATPDLPLPPPNL
jgi:endonuclease YncB( thermonuclease family)